MRKQDSPGIPHPKTSQPPLGLISGLGNQKHFEMIGPQKKSFRIIDTSTPPKTNTDPKNEGFS